MRLGMIGRIRIFICMLGVICVFGGLAVEASDKQLPMTVEEAAAALESGESEIILPAQQQAAMLRELFRRYPSLGYLYDGLQGSERKGIADLTVSVRDIGESPIHVIATKEAFRRLVSDAMLRAESTVHLVIRSQEARGWDYETLLRNIERTQVLTRSYLSHHAWRQWEQQYSEDIYVQISFGYTQRQTDIIEKKKQAEAAAISLANSIFSEEMTVWERILLAHDVLTYRCSYASGEDAPDLHSAYGALCEGRAVCEGYAEAFALLMEMGGIACQVVSGETESGVSHAWNLVEAEGSWYHVDATWDDGSEKGVYPYFLKNDRQFEESHRWNRAEYPSADGGAVTAEEIRDGLRTHGLKYTRFETATQIRRVQTACMAAESFGQTVTPPIEPQPLEVPRSDTDLWGLMFVGMPMIWICRKGALIKNYEIVQKRACYLRKKRV